MAIDFRHTREFMYDHNDEASLAKELVLQVRKVIGPFAAPKKIFIVSDLPKTCSGKASPGLCLPQHSFTD
jgi:acyl-CoA synthetase (AMP-forming)/AMP-acid ligase II